MTAVGKESKVGQKAGDTTIEKLYYIAWYQIKSMWLYVSENIITFHFFNNSFLVLNSLIVKTLRKKE